MTEAQVALLIFAFGAGFMLADHLWWRREFRRLNNRIDEVQEDLRHD